MATSLADTHLAGQSALTSLIPDLLRQAWPLLDPHNIQGTMPRFMAAVKAIVARYGSASAAGALDYYRRERAAAGVTGPATLKVAPSPADPLIEEAVRYSTAALYGPVTGDTLTLAQSRLDEAVSQLVLDQGRATVIDNVKTDRFAKGWVRVTEPGACSFCLMLALRGATYKSVRSANFEAHDNCRCHAEPIFNAYEPSAQMRATQATWTDATKGKSGAEARKAFRAAVEGRAYIPPKPKPKTPRP